MQVHLQAVWRFLPLQQATPQVLLIRIQQDTTVPYGIVLSRGMHAVLRILIMFIFLSLVTLSTTHRPRRCADPAVHWLPRAVLVAAEARECPRRHWWC
jgi:hypothetical protein